MGLVGALAFELLDGAIGRGIEGDQVVLREAALSAHVSLTRNRENRSQTWDSVAEGCLPWNDIWTANILHINMLYIFTRVVAHNMLVLTAPHERGEIRLFNVARLRGVLRPARSKNLERTMPIARALPDRMEIASDPRLSFARGVL